MSFFVTIPYISKNAVILLSFAAFGGISLASCSRSQPPSARVETSLPTVQQVSTSESPTLKNLQAAYNGESNAHVMYLAFSKQADKQGYKEVASLFRAAARAEEIHRDNHAKVIRELGATPKNNITTPEVKSTQENLETAIKGESYERDTMYPRFIKQAKAEKNGAAVQTLSYAQAAEAQHAQLYAQAKNNLASWRQAAQPFYVCTVSGETWMKQSDTSKCPASNTNKPFEKVS